MIQLSEAFVWNDLLPMNCLNMEAEVSLFGGVPQSLGWEICISSKVLFKFYQDNDPKDVDHCVYVRNESL